jgi:hypothetical protein
MDQTAVYFESKSKTVVPKKGIKSVSAETVVGTTTNAQWWLPLKPMIPSCPLSLYLKGNQANSLRNK